MVAYQPGKGTARVQKPEPRRIEVVCPACTTTDARPLGRLPAKLDPSFHAYVHRCRACGSAFTWPVNSPAELEEFYTAAFEGGVGEILRESGEAKLKMAQVLLAEMEPWLPTGGRVLDIGAGLGEWLELLHKGNRFDAYYGLEFSESMVQDLEKRCPWAEISLSSAEEVGSLLGPEPFALITLIAVIEHLHDPQMVLQYISKHLAVGGRTIIVYPRVDSSISRIMGTHWHLFSPVAHLTLYSKKGLTAAMARAGLRVVESRRLRHYYDLPYVFSFMKYFFPWAGRFVSRLATVKSLKGIGFRLYTGIDVVVAEPVRGMTPGPHETEGP